ncbi:MAG: transcriptional repressor LexA [Clostridiales bacterium]|nr:transcriptional repressor LexA [Clostridiales bacterium]
MQSNDKKTIERVYNYICDYINNKQISPSVRDICAGVGLKSTSSVHTYLKQLDSQGRIEYRPGLRRAIVIKQGTDDISADYSASASVTELAGFRKVPVVGKITAGIPILAHEDYSESFLVSKSLIGDSEAFMLKVRGNSMINAHILDGDLIIVRKQNTCEEGDIIAALIEDEATVKRFGKKNGIPYLFPENDEYSPIPFNSEGCRILGKVVGLHRYSID